MKFRLRQHLYDREHGAAAEQAALAAGRTRRVTNVQLPELDSDAIYVSKLVALAADVPWETESLVLQTARATPSFHHLPWFDVVRVRRATGGFQGRQPEAFARLLLLFKYGDLQLAYVKWFEPNPGTGTDLLASWGCKRVRYQMLRDHARSGRSEYHCSVIDIASIISREYCCRDYSDSSGMAHHISSFVRIQG